MDLEHEHRQAHRSASCLRGIISTAGKEPDRSCALLDFSDTGARLSVADPSTIPSHFTLHVPLRNETHDVVVVWRKSGELGVKFARDSEDLDPKLAQLSQKLDLILDLVTQLHNRQPC